MTIRITKARRGYKATADTGEWTIGSTIDGLINKFTDEYADIWATNGVTAFDFCYAL